MAKPKAPRAVPKSRGPSKPRPLGRKKQVAAPLFAAGSAFDPARVVAEIEVARAEGWEVVVEGAWIVPDKRRCEPLAVFVRNSPDATLRIPKQLAAVLGIREQAVWDFHSGMVGRTLSTDGMVQHDEAAYQAGAAVGEWLRSGEG